MRRLLFGDVSIDGWVGQGDGDLGEPWDGTARYLNYSGKTLVWEDRADLEIQAAINRWLAAGPFLAAATTLMQLIVGRAVT